MAEFSGTPTGQHRRFAVVASRFNQQIVERLVDGALDALVRHGASADDVDVVWVPGAWELPIAARRLLATERYHALVAVGAVIRGDTPHFDYISAEASRGIGQAALDADVPIIFGVLTTDTVAQAIDRAEPTKFNRGGEAAKSAIEMATVMRMIRSAEEVSPAGEAAGKNGARTGRVRRRTK